MKKSILIVALLMVSIVGCNNKKYFGSFASVNDSIGFSTDSIVVSKGYATFCNLMIDSYYNIDFPILEDRRVDKSNNHYNYYRLIVGEKYLYIDADSNLVITDSLQSIQILLKAFLNQMDRCNDIQSKYDSIIYQSAYKKQL